MGSTAPVAPAFVQATLTASRSQNTQRSVAAFLALGVPAVIVSQLEAEQSDAWMLAWGSLIIGHGIAWASWSWRPALFAPGRTFTAMGPFASLVLSLGVLLLLVPAQRGLHSIFIGLSAGTVWEGLASGFAWGIVVLVLPLAGVGAWFLWRSMTHAVLEGRLSPRIPHSLVRTGLVVGAFELSQLVAATLVAVSPVTPDVAWARLARAVSVFIGEYGPPLWALYGSYAATLVGLAILIGPAESRLPPLIVLTLRRSEETSWSGADELHRLACTWGEARGPVVLVRPASTAPRRAGVHARWAWFAGRLEELFVRDAHAARRWCSAWMGPRPPKAPGLFLKECFVGDPGALGPLVAGLHSMHPRALFVLVLGHAPDNAWLEELRHALPKHCALSLAEPGSEAARVPRLSSVIGSLAGRRATQRLVATLERHMLAPPPERRIAVVGRRRSDGTADRLVMALDQRKDPAGQLIDAWRPTRDYAGDHETVLLVLDVAWLAGEREARAEAATLGSLLAAARRVAVVAEADVSAVMLKRAVMFCGWRREVDWCGALPRTDDVAGWSAIADSVLGASAPAPPRKDPPAGSVRLVLAEDQAESITEGLVQRIQEALVERLGVQNVIDAARIDFDAELALIMLSPQIVATLELGADLELRRRLEGELLRAARVLALLLDDASVPRRGLEAALLSRLGSLPPLRLRRTDPRPSFPALADAVASALSRGPSRSGSGAVEATRASIAIVSRPAEASLYALGRLEEALAALPSRPQVWRSLLLQAPPRDDELRRAIEGADLVLVLIDTQGPDWLHEKAGEELAAAMYRGTPMACILLDEARIPQLEHLPPSLAELSKLLAVDLPLRRGGQQALGNAAAKVQQLLDQRRRVPASSSRS